MDSPSQPAERGRRAYRRSNVDVSLGNFGYYPFKVKWALNVKHEELNKVLLVNAIINPILVPNGEENYALWREIALHESLEYLLYSVKKIMGVEYTAGDKTISVVNNLLDNFSVSQVYNLFYRSTNNALRFQREQDVSMTHAANTIVGNARSYGDRAKLEGWDLKKYSREKECPESALSKFFFERVLKIGYNGFNEKPSVL